MHSRYAAHKAIRRSDLEGLIVSSKAIRNFTNNMAQLSSAREFKRIADICKGLRYIIEEIPGAKLKIFSKVEKGSYLDIDSTNLLVILL
jgi:hypothetical protein